MTRRSTGRGRAEVVVVAAAVGVLGVLPASASASASAADDLTCPVLHSVTMPSQPVRPGEAATVQLGVSDDGGLARSEAQLSKQGVWGRTEWLASAPGDPGALRTDVTPTSADGDYVIDSVVVHDTAGNRSVYTPITTICRTSDGRVDESPAILDLGSRRLSIAGAKDLSAPVLLGLDAPDTTSLDRPTIVGWHVAESTGVLASVQITWRKPSGVEVVVSATDVPVDGTGRLTLDHPGRSQLASVVLTDREGHTSHYVREGLVTYSYPSQSWMATQRHSIDFSQFDIGTPPRSPSAVARAVPGGVLVSMGDSLGQAATIRLAVEPGGIVRQVRVGAVPTVVRLGGLPNGVTHTWSVTAANEFGTGPALRGSFVPRLSTNVAVVQDVTHDGEVDVVALRPWASPSNMSDDVRIYSTNGRGGFTRAWTESTDQTVRQIGPARPGGHHPEPSGTYLTVDGRGDLVEEHPYILPIRLGRGWSGLRSLDGGYDLNGDGTGDILAVDPAGHLRVYARTSAGKLVRWPDIGTGWGSMLAVLSAGDLNGDRRNDIVAADTSGRLWLYPGNGRGGVTVRKQIGAGWQSMGSIFAMRDFNGDGRADIGAVTADGRLLMYRGTGTGGLRAGVQVGSGWDMYF